MPVMRQRTKSCIQPMQHSIFKPEFFSRKFSSQNNHKLGKQDAGQNLGHSALLDKDGYPKATQKIGLKMDYPNKKVNRGDILNINENMVIPGASPKS